MKRCSHCKIEKSVNDFHKNRRMKDGFHYCCKVCVRAWQQSDKGQIAQKRISQSQKTKEYNRLYQRNSPVAKAYKESAHGKAVQRRAALQWKKTEKGRAAERRYLESDAKHKAGLRWERSQKGKAYSAMKDAKRRAATVEIGNLTADQWFEILTKYNHKCVYCGSMDKLTRDHYIPLAHGGIHSPENIVPACLSCNSKKSARHPHRLF